MPCCAALKCSNRTDSSKLSFFRFPHSDKDRLRQWIRNMNRKNWTPSIYSRLCANHFTSDCFSNKSAFRVTLTAGAVPTMFYPYLSPKIKPRRTRTSQGLRASQVSVGILAELPVVNHDHDYLSLSYAQPLSLEPVGPEGNNARPRKNELLHTRNKLVSSRKAAKLRQQRIRRLQRKVKSLSSLTADLKKKLLFNCNRAVETSFDGIAKEILTRVQRKSKSVSVSDDLKHFAITLHSYSPKAYEFVRESFNCVLPHPQTVKSWCRAKSKHADSSKNGSEPKPDTEVRETPKSDSNISAASATPSYAFMQDQLLLPKSEVFIPGYEKASE